MEALSALARSQIMRMLSSVPLSSDCSRSTAADSWLKISGLRPLALLGDGATWLLGFSRWSVETVLDLVDAIASADALSASARETGAKIPTSADRSLLVGLSVGVTQAMTSIRSR